MYCESRSRRYCADQSDTMKMGILLTAQNRVLRCLKMGLPLNTILIRTRAELKHVAYPVVPGLSLFSGFPISVA